MLSSDIFSSNNDVRVFLEYSAEHKSAHTNVYEENELPAEATDKKYLSVRKEG